MDDTLTTFEKFIVQPPKKSILFISDDARQLSGVAIQSGQVMKSLVKKGYRVIQIGVTNIEQPQNPINFTFPTGEQITIIPSRTYCDINLIMNVVKGEKIDLVCLMQDPHFFEPLFIHARTIRNAVPVLWWTLWDSQLLPKDNGKPHYNTWMYESCNTLAAISKQSENFCRQIVDRLDETKRPFITYIPHGQDENIFRPLPEDEIAKFKKHLFPNGDFDFIALFDSRNQGRKKAADLIYAWELFNQSLSPEQAVKTVLLLHTERVSMAGTDLTEVKDALAPSRNIFIDEAKVPAELLNLLYNASDVVCQVSNAEGFGISCNQALLAGRPLIGAVTGGIQDSIGFFDKAGSPIQFTKDFCSNSDGKYKTHGCWSYPVYPACRTVVGSPQTPYLFDEDVSHEGIKEALLYWYNVPADERNRRGLKGRDYALTNKMNSKDLAELFEQAILKTIADYKKDDLFELYPV